jgi:hypothetical protein
MEILCSGCKNDTRNECKTSPSNDEKDGNAAGRN